MVRYVGDGDLTGALHFLEFCLVVTMYDFHYLLLQQSPGWFDVLLPD